MTKFEQLYNLDISKMVEKKPQGKDKLGKEKPPLIYLSWAHAWREFTKVYPDASFKVIKNDNNLPYFHDECGAMVYTEVTADNSTYSMWLPVMDSKNNAMKSIDYQYSTRFGTSTVSAYTMFDINKTIMRCLVKNLSLFGLGLPLYTGEDIPVIESELTTPGIKVPQFTLGQIQKLYNSKKKSITDQTYTDKFDAIFNGSEKFYDLNAMHKYLSSL